MSQSAAQKRYALKHKDRLKLQRDTYRASEKGKLSTQAYLLQKLYGLSVEQYQEMLTQQNGVCFICKLPETRVDKNGNITALTVDHNHTCCPGIASCGKCVRKLLCQKCNSALGFLDENPDRIRNMAHYVEMK